MAIEERLIDKRIVSRSIEKGLLDPDEYRRALEELPDRSDNIREPEPEPAEESKPREYDAVTNDRPAEEQPIQEQPAREQPAGEQTAQQPQAEELTASPVPEEQPLAQTLPPPQPVGTREPDEPLQASAEPDNPDV